MAFAVLRLITNLNLVGCSWLSQLDLSPLSPRRLAAGERIVEDAVY
jgi:hypothetical protein